ncbi:MAG: DMT family transporter [Alphaproteobacteria bacterium]
MTPFKAMPPIVQAALLMTFSGLSFGLMNAGIRAVGTDLHTFEVVFFRNFFALLVMLPWVLFHISELSKIDRLPLHILRSLIGLVGMYLFFYSIEIIAIADTVALTFSAPLFVLIGAVVFLGEKVRLRRWVATIIGFVGVLVIIQPGSSGFNPMFAVPLLASLFIAGALLLVKHISKTNNPYVMVFVMTLVTTPVSLVPALAVWQTPTPEQWVWLFALGLLGTIAHVFFTQAFKLVETSAVIPFDYLRLPFTALFAFLLFGEIPGLNLWIGAALVVSATLYIARREAQIAAQSSALKKSHER